ncbi:CoA-transferase family III domain-containing protein [Hyaloraphidium curvatum]|nr:CoA-transferase family III domain-containing protein [Hyaloraphidium curvatum]
MGWGVCGLLDPSFVVDGAEGEAGRAGSWRAWALPEKLAREYLRPPDSADSADEPAELALKPGEQDTSRLQQTSLVDFVEVPAPDPKAILRGPDGGLGDGDRERGLLVDPLRSGHGVQLPLVIPFDSLVIAEGEASRLIRRLGFSRKVNKFANAIGIVVNLDFSPGAGPTSPERRIPERVVWRASADWRSSVLGPLADAGFHAENLEYLRGAAAHFIAATTRILDLLTAGIVRADRGRVRDTLRGDNVDLDALRELARKLARALGIPDDAPLSAKHGVQVFDFSARGLCTEVARVLEADGGPDALVLPAGDTMQNPYWPQGLGINRGFHNALDAVWTAYLRLLAHPPSPPLDERRDAFRTADYLTFSPACLAPAAGWTADPCSRYAQAVYARRHLDDVAAGRPPGVLPRIREALGLREAAVSPFATPAGADAPSPSAIGLCFSGTANAAALSPAILAMAPHIFSNLFVLEVASYIAGPSAATILSDFGADVVRIEQLDGDLYRRYFPGQSFHFDLTARNKRNAAMDIKDPRCFAALMKLVERADVFLTNYLPPIRTRLGIGYEDLRKINPRLIYATVSGYGDKGPEAEKPGFDATAYWGRSGLQDTVRPDPDGPPAGSAVAQGDYPTSMSLFASIMVALYRRQITGEGGYATTNLLHNGIFSNSTYVYGALRGADLAGEVPQPTRATRPRPLVNMYRCRCGGWLFMTVVQEKQVAPLCRILGMPELVDDPRFATGEARAANNVEVTRILDGLFARHDRADLIRAMDEVGITYGRISTVAEAAADPTAHANGVFVPYADGRGMTVANPINVSGVDKVAPRWARGLGEDTAEVLKSAGVDGEEFRRMVEDGVVIVAGSSKL